jgi:SAM-dependent methyltransferase
MSSRKAVLDNASIVKNVATAYNGAGSHYASYADGDAENLFSFSGLHSYADRCLWDVLDAKLHELKARGASSVRILDAGCGPGTWLRRIVVRAHQIGFSEIYARGFDIAAVQIESARRRSRELSALPGVTLAYDVGDLLARLPEAEASVDIAICLYSVLSHLPVNELARVMAELSRVTRGHLVVTVRSIGSAPTVFVDAAENANSIELDHRRNRCLVEFRNGSRMDVPFHLFSAIELRHVTEDHFEIEDLSGLDIFHNRFVPDRHWNPPSCKVDEKFENKLCTLEEDFAHNPAFIDHAAHLLLVGKRRQAALAHKPVRSAPEEPQRFVMRARDSLYPT